MGSGYISSRLNHATTIFLSSTLSWVVLVLLGFSTGFPVFCSLLFFLGTAAGLYLPSAISTISAVMPRAYLARGMAIHELEGSKGVAVSFCIPVAFVIGGGVLPMLMGYVGDVFSIGAGVSCGGAMIFCAGICAHFLRE